MHAKLILNLAIFFLRWLPWEQQGSSVYLKRSTENSYGVYHKDVMNLNLLRPLLVKRVSIETFD